MIKATTDARLKAGTAQRRQPDAALDDTDIAPREPSMHNRAIPLSHPCLTGKYTVIVRLGKFFRNVQRSAASRRRKSTATARTIFSGVNQKPFQLRTSGSLSLRRIKPPARSVIMHCHHQLIALTYVLETTPGLYSPAVGRQRQCWWYSRMALAFCRGWCGTSQNRRATAQRCKHSLVWPFHGVFGGSTLDETFGLSTYEIMKVMVDQSAS